MPDPCPRHRVLVYAEPVLMTAFPEPTLVQIPEGHFSMGSATGQENELPVHQVWTDTFLMAATQVTNAHYALFMKAAIITPPLNWTNPLFNHPGQPVTAISWFEAVQYCEWLSAETSRHYRLPTEAEWERASRGGIENKLFPWGDAPPESLPDYANRWKAAPEPVALHAANPYGLYNMCDNVHEWCSDWFDSSYYAASPERNPRGPEAGTRRASRGGSWRHHIKVTRCAARSSIPPDFHYADYGFRVACDF